MPELSASDVATSWLQKWNGAEPSDVPFESRMIDLDLGLPRSDPELCLASIAELLTRIPADPANRHFQLLAAGPLEDLLSAHGDTMLDKIDALARRDPAFRRLLNGAWLSSASPAIQERLRKYLGNPW